MIEHIGEQNLGAALDLLAVGFNTRPRSYWEHAAERISEFGGNAALNLPIGLLMRDGDRATGVAFTIASQRPYGDRNLCYVNFAAWYVEADQRWRAPLMLRALTRLKCDVITDFTPSQAVRDMLPALGFKPVTRGVVFNVAAFGGGPRARVMPIAQASNSAGAIFDVLRAHERFGCVAAVLETEGGATIPLLFKFDTWRGAKVARLMYCASNRELFAHRGAVNSFLRARGAVLTKLDVPIDHTPPGIFRPERDVRFVRGAAPADVTDYLGSELALLDM